jgi:Spermidine/putrescine-binding periplasmic protein
MRKTTLPLLALAAALISGCGSSKEKLSVFIWNDYVSPELIKQFEKENNCRVMMGHYDSNETMLAKIQAGASGYDILVPSSYMVETLASQGMLEKIDKSKIPNITNIDPAYLEAALDAKMTYGVPYMISFTGIAYRTDKIPEIKNTWQVFIDLPNPNCRNRIALMDDPRETIGAALISKGYSLNTTNTAELAEAGDVVIEWKKNVAKFDNEAYKVGIASGEFVLVHGYSCDIAQVQSEDGGENIGFFFPDEGYPMACDELVIMKNAPNKELAYKFINFIHDGKNAAKNMDHTFCWSPNTAAYEFVPENIKNNPIIFPSADVIARGKVIRNFEGANVKLHSEIWDKIKAAK